MQLSQARPIAVDPSAEARVAGRMAQWIAAVSAGLLLLLALVLLARRFSGQVSRPLDGHTLAATAVILAVLAVAVRAGWIWTLRSPSSLVGRRFVLFVPMAGLLLLAIAVSIPGSSPPALALFWAILVTEEAVAMLLATRVSGWRGFRFSRANRSVSVDTEISHPADPLPPMSADVTQQMTRVSLPDGSDELRGQLRGRFAAGQRMATLHIAFCPPFASDPDFQVQQVSGPPVTIKSTIAMPQGARIDVRLDRVEQPDPHDQQVLLRIVARGKRVSLDPTFPR